MKTLFLLTLTLLSLSSAALAKGGAGSSGGGGDGRNNAKITEDLHGTKITCKNGSVYIVSSTEETFIVDMEKYAEEVCH